VKLSLTPLLALPLGLLLVSGCAVRPPAVAPADAAVWQAHRATLASLRDWQLQGRVAVQHERRGWNAGFDWRQRHADYRIRLRGPFGQGGIELEGNSDGVWMRQQDKPAVYARHVEDVLARETGWRLPVLGLVDWLRGLPVEGQPAALTWDAQGRLKTLQQAGWQIDFSRYRQVGDLQLPDKILLRRDRLRVKLLVDDWRVP